MASAVRACLWRRLRQ